MTSETELQQYSGCLYETPTAEGKERDWRVDPTSGSEYLFDLTTNEILKMRFEGLPVKSERTHEGSRQQPPAPRTPCSHMHCKKPVPALLYAHYQQRLLRCRAATTASWPSYQRGKSERCETVAPASRRAVTSNARKERQGLPELLHTYLNPCTYIRNPIIKNQNPEPFTSEPTVTVVQRQRYRTFTIA